ncbi:hypothetical protein BDV39DRAFT_206921 [Aspergillus sergii]|uniref:Uncharacterized protein n=1 Tax=Aspergillus sergii TaxID=1034303 RepID=A0A5N6WXN6_9EURO|nr:hypothetical protein BDV39DRAFT_206921 [Aspergillus sergii]
MPSVNLPGRWRWVKAVDIKPGPGSTFDSTHKWSWTNTVSKTQFIEKAEESARKQNHNASISTHVEGSYGIVSASVDASYEYASEVTATMKSINQSEVKDDIVKSENLEHHLNVKENGWAVIYQLQFEGPGLNFRTPRTAVRPGKCSDFEGENATGEVDINCELAPVRFLHDIEVKIASTERDMPHNHIPVIGDKSADVNRGFGKAKYVWLIPKYITEPDPKKFHSETASSIFISRTDNRWDGYDDIHSGAGGDYRYVRMIRNENARRKITDVAMLRSPSGQRKTMDDVHALGFHGMSSDLNEDRGEEYLYLIWKLSGAIAI